MNLQDIITWLRHVEDLACSVYSAAAKSKVVSEPFSAFLKGLAEDEAMHFHLMNSASGLLREQETPLLSDILIDDETKLKIETPFYELLRKIQSETVTERDILTFVVQSESSEWNDFFLYVITRCTQISNKFQHIAACIQAHKKHIENYVETVSSDTELTGSIRSLPEIWKTHLLIAEDDEAVRGFMERVLSRYGTVSSAENGEIALAATRNQFFNVIITDVDMPVMNGINFLQQAVKENEHLRPNFIICTGRPTETVEAVAQENEVPLLKKPVSIKNLYEAIEQTLASTT
jgi:CheY-like chemotaxis protein